MKLENQVCTQAQADRLKELGIAQEALFYHTHSEKWGVMPRKSIDFSGNPAAAFTAAELGIMLPEWISKGQQRYRKEQWANTLYGDSKPAPYEFRIDYRDDHENSFAHHTCKEKTEAQARAAMLIYLLENNYITAAEVNARLEKEEGI